jgi:hypothetical protein
MRVVRLTYRSLKTRGEEALHPHVYHMFTASLPPLQTRNTHRDSHHKQHRPTLASKIYQLELKLLDIYLLILATVNRTQNAHPVQTWMSFLAGPGKIPCFGRDRGRWFESNDCHTEWLVFCFCFLGSALVLLWMR